MIGYIYMMTDVTNGKKYVGQHRYDKEELDPYYHGSGHIIKQIYKKRPETIKEEYVKTCYTQQELDEWEKYFIFTNNTLHPNGYNLKDGGGGGIPCEETLKKLSKSHKGIHQTEKTKKKISETLKGRIFSDEHRRKISKALKERKYSDEFKNKISNTLTGKYVGEKSPMFGKHHSEETKKKLSEALKGKKPWNKGIPMSEEQKKKLSETHKGQKGYWNGKKRSEETKKKISETKTGVLNTKKSKPVLQYSLNGILINEWPSMMEAHRNGFLSSKICNCCLGKKPQYKGFIWKYK